MDKGRVLEAMKTFGPGYYGPDRYGRVVIVFDVNIGTGVGHSLIQRSWMIISDISAKGKISVPYAASLSLLYGWDGIKKLESKLPEIVWTRQYRKKFFNQLFGEHRW